MANIHRTPESKTTPNIGRSSYDLTPRDSCVSKQQQHISTALRHTFINRNHQTIKPTNLQDHTHV